MNFSGFSSKKLLGRILRLPLRLIPPQAVLPVLQGRLRGKKWIVGAGTHGCWLGSYELAKQQKFCEALKPGDVVFDIGAHVGFYTLLASVLVGPTGRVFAFEPAPRNLGYLRRHLGLNSITNVEVIDKAVTEQNGWLEFASGEDSYTGAVARGGNLKVAAASLDSFCQESKVIPRVIKMDIEGSEESALRGAAILLRQNHPLIFLATHSPALKQSCCQLLETLGYQLTAADARPWEETDEILAIYPKA